MSTVAQIQLLWSIDAENALLGAVLIDGARYADAAYLGLSDFHDLRNSAVWQTICDLRSQDLEIDTTSVALRMEQIGKLDEIGGPAYLTFLAGTPLNLGSVRQYAQVIRDMAQRRKILSEANEQARRAYDLTTPIPQDELNIRPRYVVRTARDALEPQPPLDWLVKGVISRGSLNIFYGEPGAKKTYSLLSLAVCAATGRPWLDFETKPCRVLFIDEESGEKRLSLRIGQALRGTFADEKTSLSYVSLAQFKLNDLRDIEVLTNLILSEGAELVIIDALADIMTGDENSKEDVQPVMNSLRKIAETTNAGIVVIHHANKGGGYRGSSAIKAAVDLMTLTSSEDGSDFINFKTEKNRDGMSLSWAARAVWTDDQFYLEAKPILEKKKPLSKSQEFVIRYIEEHGETDLSEIMNAADVCSSSAARQAVYALVSVNRIRRTNPGATGTPARYDMVLDDQQEKDI